MSLLSGGDWDVPLTVLLEPLEGLLERTWAGGYKPIADTRFGDGKYDLPNHRAEAWARDRAGALITEVAGVTHDRVENTVRTILGDAFDNPDVSIDDVESAILDEFESMSEARAALIADTEAAYAAGSGAASAARDAGLEYVQISDGTESDQACADADGQVWSLDDYEANILEHPGCGRSADFLSADEADGLDITEPD